MNISAFKRMDPDLYRILDFKIFKLRFTWVIDCGEWFIYINWASTWWVRFSGAGYLHSKKLHK